jgi:HSP20 family protein
MADEERRNLIKQYEGAGLFDVAERLSERMNALTRELQEFGLGSTLARGLPGETRHIWKVDMDLCEEDDRYELTLDIPGVDREDINLRVYDDHLVVEGRRELEKEEKRQGFMRAERFTGRFARRVPLSPDVDHDNIEASLDNGVLNVNVPKSEESRGKQVDIG